MNSLIEEKISSSDSKVARSISDKLEGDLFIDSQIQQNQCTKNEEVSEATVARTNLEDCLFGSAHDTSVETAKTAETICSGESLFKCFSFNPSRHDESITNKCVSFWKTVYDTPQLQPCPCTFLKAPEVKKLSNDVETTPRNFNVTWYDVLLEFQKRKMDDLAVINSIRLRERFLRMVGKYLDIMLVTVSDFKSATNNTCKMCDQNNAYYKFKKRMHPQYSCEELKEHDDIICLNDWKASSHSSDEEKEEEEEEEEKEEPPSPELVTLKRGLVSSKCVKCGMKSCACYENEQRQKSIEKSLAESIPTIDTSKRLCKKCGVVGCNCLLCDDPDNNESLQPSFSIERTSAGVESSQAQYVPGASQDIEKLSQFCSKCGLDGCYCGICKMSERKKKSSTNSALQQIKKGRSKEVIEDEPSARLSTVKQICKRCGVQNCQCVECRDFEDPESQPSEGSIKHDVSRVESLQSNENENSACLNCGVQECRCNMCRTNNQNRRSTKQSLDKTNNLKKMKQRICNECGVAECKCNLCTRVVEEESNEMEEEDVQIILPTICQKCGVRYCKCTSCYEQDDVLPDDQEVKRTSKLKSSIQNNQLLEEKKLSGTKSSKIKTLESSVKVLPVNENKKNSKGESKSNLLAPDAQTKSLRSAEKTPITKPDSEIQPKQQETISTVEPMVEPSVDEDDMSHRLYCEKCGKTKCNCGVCYLKMSNISLEDESLSKDSRAISDDKSKQFSVIVDENGEVCCEKYGTNECPCQICVPPMLKKALKCEFCGSNCKCWDHQVNNARHLLDDLKYKVRYDKPTSEKACSTEKGGDEEVVTEVNEKIKCIICGKCDCHCKKLVKSTFLQSFDKIEEKKSKASIIPQKSATKNLSFSLFNNEPVNLPVKSSRKPPQKPNLLTFKELKQRTSRKSSLDIQQHERKLVLTPEQRAKNMVVYNKNVVLRIDKYDIPQVVKYKDGRSIPKAASSNEMFPEPLETFLDSGSKKSSQGMDVPDPWICVRMDNEEDANDKSAPNKTFGRKL